MAVTAQILRLTRFFFTTTVSEEIPEHMSEREIESEPFALVICLPRTAPTSCCQLLSPASGAYLGRAHSVADVHVIAHSVLVVGYPKLPAFDSAGAGTVMRLARGKQCSCTSGRMITACALHSVMCCTTCSTVTGGGKQYPRGTVFPSDGTATVGLKRKENVVPSPTLHSGTPISQPFPPAATL